MKKLIPFVVLQLVLFATVTTSGQQAAPIRMTLDEAIAQGLKANLGVLVAASHVDESEGTRLRSLSAALLPRVTSQAYANVQNRDLKAFGISLPGFPSVVGPFSNYDFRIYAQQNIVDLTSLRQFKASEDALAASKLDYRDAQDLVVRSVASMYLNAQSANALVESAHSRVVDSEALLKLAADKHDAGTATGVDVLRAQVQLANDRQSLLIAENQLKQSVIQLARNIGLDPGTPIEIAEPFEFRPLPEQSMEILAAAALSERADYLSLASQRRALVEQKGANHARNYPRLSLNGNIGEIGRSIGGVQTTGLIQGQIDFTLFDKDRSGEAIEIENRIKRIDAQMADLRRGIEQDLRVALLNLQSSAEQVAVARDGESLAHRELEMAEDRFKVGTANNVEVITAQDQLARAEQNTILALSGHMDAKYALARAMGETAKRIKTLEMH